MGYEGLAELEDSDDEGGALLRITDEGRKQFVILMTSGIRAPVNDVSKLIIALKMRFLDLLERMIVWSRSSSCLKCRKVKLRVCAT